MAIDFKNIQFKYIKITAGASVIDVTMDDKKFYTNKPDGYYKCFIFPASVFGGVDYEDLQNLVSIEEKNIWNKINRDTFLGYNEETNTFIVNISAYMGLKDSDLKTDGSLDYAGQVGWYEMNISTTKSDSIITLRQIDGTNVYLKIKPHNDSGKFSYGNICIEHTKKKVAETNIFKKNSAMWCKSPEDNSVQMVCSNLPQGRISSYSYTYTNSNKIMNLVGSGGRSSWNCNYQCLQHGKPVVYFESASSQKLTQVCAVGTYDGYIKNNTGKEFVEYTETSDLNDILTISGEQLLFQLVPKRNFIWACKDTINNKNIKAQKWYNDTPKIFNPDIGINPNSNITFSPYSSTKNTTSDCNLYSINPKDKPFVYISEKDSFNISGYKEYKLYINPNTFISKLQDGFIVCVSCTAQSSGSPSFILRFKNGEPVKKRSTSTSNYIEIGNATGATNNIFNFQGGALKKSIIDKDDLINGTGFTDVSPTEIFSILGNASSGFATILKI